ncbi:hypothetical protein F383_06693 [Gossypium arboreum]|uniref:Uncharacterized protein n=1 Tax=Gossypium arboreum TaxID=29729 RepID=A0A0B0P1B7_GOSAR|nr:hypothetical protein F383_06693 [Gossypium arboreum]
MLSKKIKIGVNRRYRFYIPEVTVKRRSRLQISSP